jgi:hypothetical protein
MIVNRYTIPVKPGKMDEAVKMALEGSKNIWSNYPTKVYTSNFGTMDRLIIDCEFKDVTEQQKLTARVVATKEWAQWIDKFNEFLIGQGTNEVWNLVE